MKFRLFTFTLTYIATALFCAIQSNGQTDDWFKYDDYNKIPKGNTNIVKRTFIANRGNKDVSASLTLNIDFPKGESLFDYNMRDLISSKIYEFLNSYYFIDYSEVYVPGKSTNNMLDYYALTYLNCLNKEIPVYVTDTLDMCTEINISRIAESKDYVTYNEACWHMDNYHSPLPHPAITNAYTTYSKQTSEPLDFHDIFLPEKTYQVKKILLQRIALAFSERREEYHTINDVLFSVAEKNSFDDIVSSVMSNEEYQVVPYTIYNFPIADVALLPDGVLFYYPKYYISYGYEGDYSILIKYNELYNYLYPHIKSCNGTFYSNFENTTEEDSSSCNKAFEYIGRGDYDSAIKCLKKHIAKNQSASDSERRLLALIHMYRSESKSALNEYVQLMSYADLNDYHKSYFTELYNCALLKFENGDTDSAHNILDLIVPEEGKRMWIIDECYGMFISAKIKYGRSIEEKLENSLLRYQIDTICGRDNILAHHNHLLRDIDILSVNKNVDNIKKQIAMWDEVLEIRRNNMKLMYPYETYGFNQLKYHAGAVWVIQNIKANLYESIKDYKNAIVSIEDGYKSMLGRSETINLKYYSYLSKLYAASSQLDEALKFGELSYSTILDYTSRAAATLPLDERNELYESIINIFLEEFPFTMSLSSNRKHHGMMFTASMIAKNLKISKERSLQEILQNSYDQDIIQKHNNLKNTLSKIDAAIYNNESSWKIDSLKTEYYKIEKYLSQKSKEFGNYLESFTITHSDIYEKLSEEDAAIEFVNFSKDGQEAYYAVILTKHSETPELIHLFNQPLSDARKQISVYDSYSLIWKHIVHKYDWVKRFYFSPAGVLNISPIENSIELSDKKQFIRLSSCAELLNKNKNMNYSSKVVLFGGLDYEADINNLSQERKVYTEYAHNSDSYIGRGTRDYLPGSLTEVKNIKASLTKKKIPVDLYTDARGSETAFKRLNGGNYNIIHIATHGEYISNAPDNSNLLHNVDETINLDDKDLTRSVLLMSGANTVLDGYASPNPFDDGILSAQEISRMDLSHVNLVILSACETGLGELNKDGVAGLQRGFKKAGVKTVIMSLWKVHDGATSIMMEDIYKYMLRGDDARSAFKKAQNGLRTSSKYSDPKYWAAFVMVD